jgi:polysaccharide pyruvyl transferase WcaK-like protein
MVGVRDPLSLRDASRLGLRRERVTLTGDDAWATEAISAHDAAGILQQNGVSSRFIVAQMRLAAITGVDVDEAKRLAALLDKLSATLGAETIFACTECGPGSRDVLSARLVSSHMKQRVAAVFDDVNPGTIKGIIGRASLAVGLAYHFAVFAVSIGTPALALHRNDYMRHKFKGLELMHPEAMAAFDLNVPDIDAEVVARAGQLLVEREQRQNRSCSSLGLRYAADPDAPYTFLAQRLARPSARQHDMSGE